MKTAFSDTIVALATPPGRGGIAIIRISGPSVVSLFDSLLEKKPHPRVATFTPFLDADQSALDEGVALYFPGPHSFTGEDVLELQGHGGPAVVNALIQRITQLGVRIARPGEFSERAFLNDKMDLVQAEAIADLIDASSTQAARSALKSLQGEFSKRITQLVEKLIHLRMYVEAAIDFAEEEIDFLGDTQITLRLSTILSDLVEVKAAAMQGSLLREGITVVIVGKPNAGKSSLLNCLSGKESAIVTPIAGTTRDVLREYIHLDGIPLHIIDTAGLRDSDDVVEQEGIRRAHQEMTKADMILLIEDATDKEASESLFATSVPIIHIRNKIDLLEEAPSIVTGDKTIISVSAKQNQGLDLLKAHMKLRMGVTEQQEGVFSARRRHMDALARAHDFLFAAHTQLQHRQGELVAEELRQAQFALSEITGEFTSDDLLGRIFSSFCIGK